VYGAGSVVTAPAGNGGPAPGTVQHQAPWITTVGALEGDGRDHVAPYSGRGPGAALAKPDLSASASGEPAGAAGLTAGAAEGTSLAAATVAGAAAVVRSAHGDWTPGQVQSALVTTARPVVDAAGVSAGLFDVGAGSVDLAAALAPGLTFGATASELGRLGRDPVTVADLNLATLSVPDMPGVVETVRTATNVSGETRRYEVSTSVPLGAWLQVAPSSFTLEPGASVQLHVQIGSAALAPGWYAGEIRLVDHGQSGADVRLPVGFQRTSNGITVDTECQPRPVAWLGQPVHCSVTTRNASPAPAEVRIMTALNRPLAIAALSGAERTGDRLATAIVTLPGAQPTAPRLDASTPSRFLDLAQLPNIEPVPLGDDVGINFTLPEFHYGTQRWTRIGIVSNGYAVVGGVEQFDVSAAPQALPSPQAPNNVLAPFWTDLEGRDGRDLYAATITDADGKQYAVFQWNVQLLGRSSEPRVFQLWVGLSGSQEIYFVYDPARLPRPPVDGPVAIGAENADGTGGALLDPALAAGPVADLAVSSDAGSDGGVYTFTMDVVAAYAATGDVSTLVSSPTMRGLAADGVWFDVLDPAPAPA
jgi:hypothetical protein